VDNAELVRHLIDRAVNRRDPTAVDDLVSPSYAGHGFAADREALRAFYAWQARTAPDWRIDVEDVVAAGDRVAVRAHAYGTRTESAPGVPLPEPVRRDVEWVAIYRVEDGLVAEVWVAVRDL
jgi:predicted SnoaL-like aldol condensation-catalyzing enzyme